MTKHVCVKLYADRKDDGRFFYVCYECGTAYEVKK